MYASTSERKPNPVSVRFRELVKQHAPELTYGWKRRRRFAEKALREPFVMMFGSNYTLFTEERCDDSSCPPETRGTWRVKAPPQAMLTALEAAFELYRYFMYTPHTASTACSSIIMPSDIVRGDIEQVADIRRRFRSDTVNLLLPWLSQTYWSVMLDCPFFVSLPSDRNEPGMESEKEFLKRGSMLFAFESDYLEMARSALDSILNGTLALPSHVQIKNGGHYGRTVALKFDGESGHVPVGVYSKESMEAYPKCQLICAKFLEELDKKLGVTHLLAAFEDRDYLCVKQGIRLAYALFGIKMKILIAGVREVDGKVYVFDSAVYPEELEA